MNKKQVHFRSKMRHVAVQMLIVGFLFVTRRARADTNVVVARAVTITNQFESYAQVEAVALLPVRAAESGVVVGLKALPGTSVKAGQKLAALGGPEIKKSLTQAEATANGARTNLLGARKLLAIRQEQLASHLATQEMLLQAESALAQSQAAFHAARAQLQSLHQTITLQAPFDGIVLTLNATDGERVNAGETILTVQPSDQLWLKAAYYETDAAAIRVGMTGQFTPANGGEPVSVKVSTVFGAMKPDGGEAVGLVATTPSPGWLNGEFGTVTLNGRTRSMVPVPTRALILDKGKWRVLVRTPQGNRPQEVIPGPTRGWQTFIQNGLQPGSEVIVENAYLEFHHDISKNYQPPN
ncbi:MAG TPA: efflux RND transporter periplasmic adaptor subunit [Verrucomicrobiae bacterium]|nr:efflux RND transporter periplasmic adaptor subunit [Verrucomicrobiae bacterium]